mmetsp:Transcript_19051/g.27073  ORF Transcript_19051/g.27073 Transcript_19051/m.27073 type:complete len:241 (-) Transcript_19051:29-751(-)
MEEHQQVTKSCVTADLEPLSSEMEAIAVSDDVPSKVEIKSNLEKFVFCVPLQVGIDDTSTTFSSAPEDKIPKTLPPNLSGGTRCVVGTITVMKRSSAFLWIGWGDCEQQESSKDSRKSRRPLSSLPPMGPLVIAMPRMNYAGTTSANEEAACSQLIGGENEEDQMIGWQMASRLTKKLGWPILVACSLASTSTSNSGALQYMPGADEGNTNALASMTSQRAAALGEKEIYRILMTLKNEI